MFTKGWGGGGGGDTRPCCELHWTAESKQSGSCHTERERVQDGTVNSADLQPLICIVNITIAKLFCFVFSQLSHNAAQTQGHPVG